MMARDKTDLTDKTPVGTPVISAKWGIPDWRDAVAYGDVKVWTLGRWRWEFLRRRQDVREFFVTWAQATYTENMEYHVEMKGSPGRPARFLEPWLSPQEPGYRILCLPDEQRRLGMTYVPNPSITPQPNYSFIYDPLSKDQKGDGVHPDGLARKITVDPGEAAIVFRLDLPLVPQMKTAGCYLSSLQSEFYEKPLQKRRHPKKWLGYLRALDGKEAGATWAEIAETFFAQGLLDRRRDDSGGYQPPSPQAARDKWDAANALCFNF